MRRSATRAEGRYPEEALEAVPPHLREKYFVRNGDDVRGRPRGAPNMSGSSDATSWIPSFRGPADVILCRNVLIYFDPETRVRTVERLIDSLVPGGFLFLGYAESLRQFETLEALRTEDGVVYRRPLPGSERTSDRTRARTSPGTSPPAPTTEDSGPPSANVTTVTPPTEMTVCLRGSTAKTFIAARRIGERNLRARAFAGPCARIIVDLDGVDFIASTRLHPSCGARRAAARAAGIGFGLVARRPGPRRWLARNGLDPQVEVPVTAGDTGNMWAIFVE